MTFVEVLTAPFLLSKERNCYYTNLCLIVASDVVVVDPCLLKDNKMSPRDHGVLIKKEECVSIIAESTSISQ